MDTGTAQEQRTPLDVTPDPSMPMAMVRRHRAAEGIVWLAMAMVVTLAFALGSFTR